jgi:hypothetical protein
VYLWVSYYWQSKERSLPKAALSLSWRRVVLSKVRIEFLNMNYLNDVKAVCGYIFRWDSMKGLIRTHLLWKETGHLLYVEVQLRRGHCLGSSNLENGNGLSTKQVSAILTALQTITGHLRISLTTTSQCLALVITHHILRTPQSTALLDKLIVVNITSYFIEPCGS